MRRWQPIEGFSRWSSDRYASDKPVQVEPTIDRSWVVMVGALEAIIQAFIQHSSRSHQPAASFCVVCVVFRKAMASRQVSYCRLSLESGTFAHLVTKCSRLSTLMPKPPYCGIERASEVARQEWSPEWLEIGLLGLETDGKQTSDPAFNSLRHTLDRDPFACGRGSYACFWRTQLSRSTKIFCISAMFSVPQTHNGSSALARLSPSCVSV